MELCALAVSIRGLSLDQKCTRAYLFKHPWVLVTANIAFGEQASVTLFLPLSGGALTLRFNLFPRRLTAPEVPLEEQVSMRCQYLYWPSRGLNSPSSTPAPLDPEPPSFAQAISISLDHPLLRRVHSAPDCVLAQGYGKGRLSRLGENAAA